MQQPANSTSYFKINISKPEQLPQKQGCRSSCIEDVCFFFPRCIKVAHVNWERDFHQLCDWFAGVRVRFPSVPMIPSFCLQWYLQFKKEVVLAAHARQYQKRAKADYKKCHCNPAPPSGRSQVVFVCVFWNLSQTSAEIRMGDNITRSWQFCSVWDLSREENKNLWFKCRLNL